MSYFPLLAATAVLAGLLSAIFIAIDLSKHPQRMKVMNAVWVLTGLWAGLLGLGAYIPVSYTHMTMPTILRV